MRHLRLHVLSLRYSSWSIRPWLALTAAHAPFETETIEIEGLGVQTTKKGPGLVQMGPEQLENRRKLGSITGLFPVLYVDGKPIHESLAIAEWVAESFPEAGLWPRNPLTRARARAICCEMVAGFHPLRSTMSCHPFASVPNYEPDAATETDIRRIFEIWRHALDTSGGPFLFGSFGLADCFYFPVLTRFRTYGVALDPALERYAQSLEAHPAVLAWRRCARNAPSIPAYDANVRKLGGTVADRATGVEQAGDTRGRTPRAVG
jgi:glutathione S-transferase